MTVVREDDGRVVYEGPRYRLELAADRLRATLASPGGEHWAALRPLAALDTADAPDETLEIGEPVVLDDRTFEVPRRSTVWERSAVRFTCGEDALEIATTVSGRGALTDAHLLAGRSVAPGLPLGFLPSGSGFRTLFTPAPSEPPRLVRGAGEAALNGVVGDGAPGRGRWLFTPAPLLFALTTADPGDDLAAEWVTLALTAPVEELTFTEVAHEAADGGFWLRLAYEGHTRVDGDFEAPLLVVTPGVADPYEGLRRHRTDLVARGHAPEPAPREVPAWWREPIFCGWGAQCHLVAGTGTFAGELATQESYDGFLARLEERGVVPGTVVLDDKWQAAYGTNEPDTAKWPDLKRWIAERHERGQRVLLWWKAWDPEGLDPALCVRNADGHAVALDPGNPAARELLRTTMHGLVGPGGLDADGLKIDFTARTPSGSALEHSGASWGIALLHQLLQVVYASVKEAKPDALVMTHTPHPAFADVTDMIRLNDMLRADRDGLLPVVPQMAYRARVVAAALPELLVDTDDWCIPDLATWREYAEAKPALGIPSLYYATHLDATGEALADEDYETLRRTWAGWRDESWSR